MAQFLAVFLVGCFAAANATAATSLDSSTLSVHPLEPENNPSTPAKIALGTRLFSDPNLSSTGTYSCASCHNPELHFTDGLSVAVGATGEQHTRNTPTLYNVAFNASFGWDDQDVTQLEQQHLIPLLNTDPVEMGFSEVLASSLVSRQRDEFEQAFTAATLNNQSALTTISQAIATYVRTLRHPQNELDHYLYTDNASALSEDAKLGLALFSSQRLGCASCHSGFTLSGPISYVGHTAIPVFHNTGVSDDKQRFRAPTLRAIRFTAPYMHAGNLQTLDAVLNHYESTQSPEVPKFILTEDERQQLLAFLNSL